MNEKQLGTWIKSVNKYNKTLSSLIEDSVSIEKLITAHLKEFFDFDEIKFHHGYKRIILMWDYDNNPVINPSVLSDLSMEFMITHEWSEKHGDGVIIEVYPFGRGE